MRRRMVASIVFAAALAGLAGAAAAADVIAKGTFAGASGHVTSGGVSVERTDAGTKVVLQQDFSLDSAPDPKVGFGRDGVYDKEAQLAPLAANKGSQSYPVPDTVDPEKYNEVYIWCEKYSVPLGVAKLQ